MVLRGHVMNGTVILEGSPKIPDGTEVRVEVVQAPPSTLLERFQGVVGAIDDLPKDMAENHDHYIHGTPKK